MQPASVESEQYAREFQTVHCPNASTSSSKFVHLSTAILKFILRWSPIRSDIELDTSGHKTQAFLGSVPGFVPKI
jgi:hypothetical protein